MSVCCFQNGESVNLCFSWYTELQKTFAGSSNKFISFAKLNMHHPLIRILVIRHSMLNAHKLCDWNGFYALTRCYYAYNTHIYTHIDVCSMHRLQTWNNLLLLVFSSSLYYQIFVQMLLSSPTTTTTTIICDIREKTFRACSYHLHSTHPLHFDAKIEMTYFIYNWNFQRCVYAYMNENVDDDYDYDCWLWPVRVFGRLHVLVHREWVEGALYPIKVYCYCLSYK